MTIGRLAAAVRLNIETIRFYQREGLLPYPAKPVRGARQYDEGHVAQLRFIRRAQELGFALAEIRQLLSLEGDQTCRAAREIAAQKLLVVQGKLADLSRMGNALKQLLARCDQRGLEGACPIIEALSQPSPADGYGQRDKC